MRLSGWRSSGSGPEVRQGTPPHRGDERGIPEAALGGRLGGRILGVWKKPNKFGCFIAINGGCCIRLTGFRGRASAARPRRKCRIMSITLTSWSRSDPVPFAPASHPQSKFRDGTIRARDDWPTTAHQVGQGSVNTGRIALVAYAGSHPQTSLPWGGGSATANAVNRHDLVDRHD